MNITVLSYAEALASAAARKPVDRKSAPHCRAAQTKRANVKALQAERLAALRGE